MANIMSSFKLRNNPSRNGFDLSNRHSFTAKIGELLPVQVKECLPGDKFNINLTHFSRTQPLTSPAYVRIKEYYDWCFVPTRLLWKYFDQFVNQMPNNIASDSLTSEQVTFQRHPYMLLSDIQYLLEQWDGGEEPFSDELGFDKSQTTVKLLEYLGYGHLDKNSDYQYNAVNPFPLLAYQKIYNDIFRFDQWEAPLPHTFNIDFMGNDPSSPSLSGLLDISTLSGDQIDMFNMRYANYPKDLIMGVLPNSQFGDVSLISVDGLSNLYSVSNGSNTGSIIALKNGQQYRLGGPNGVGDYSLQNSNVFNFSILALRQAEFLQKWKEVAQTAKQDYRDQIKAHWNVDVSKARSGITEYLGGITSNVQIDGAVNNNLTEGSTIIKGTAISGSRGNIEFEAPEHGILMCIYHAAPMLDYNAKYATDPFVFKNAPTDYAIPELDKTGMQLVPSAFLSNNIDINHLPNYLGYAPRYIEYKTDIDKTFGAFNSTLSNWVAPFRKLEVSSASTSLWTYKDFKVDSRIFNDVFAVNVSPSVSSDQLLCNADFNIKCVRNLDVNGMPY